MPSRKIIRFSIFIFNFWAWSAIPYAQVELQRVAESYARLNCFKTVGAKVRGFKVLNKIQKTHDCYQTKGNYSTYHLVGEKCRSDSQPLMRCKKLFFTYIFLILFIMPQNTRSRCGSYCQIIFKRKIIICHFEYFTLSIYKNEAPQMLFLEISNPHCRT